MVNVVTIQQHYLKIPDTIILSTTIFSFFQKYILSLIKFRTESADIKIKRRTSCTH